MTAGRTLIILKLFFLLLSTPPHTHFSFRTKAKAINLSSKHNFSYFFSLRLPHLSRRDVRLGPCHCTRIHFHFSFHETKFHIFTSRKTLSRFTEIMRNVPRSVPSGKFLYITRANFSGSCNLIGLCWAFIQFVGMPINPNSSAIPLTD